MAQASFLEFINKMGKVTRRYYDQTEVLYVYNTSGELIKATDDQGMDVQQRRHHQEL